MYLFEKSYMWLVLFHGLGYDLDETRTKVEGVKNRGLTQHLDQHQAFPLDICNKGQQHRIIEQHIFMYALLQWNNYKLK